MVKSFMAQSKSGDKTLPPHTDPPPGMNEGTHALTSDLRADSGGWNPKGYAFPLKNKQENGRWVVTYRFDKLTSDHMHDYVDKIHALTIPNQVAALHGFNMIEEVAPITFRPAQAGEVADIVLFGGSKKPGQGDWVGKASNHTRTNHEIFIDDACTSGRSAILHEIMHALGFSHPHADGRGGSTGGDNPAFSDMDTILSYLNGGSKIVGLAADDCDALRHVYGSMPDKPGAETVRMANLANSLFIDSQTPVTLDFSEATGPGMLKITDRAIWGNSGASELFARFTATTRFRNVRTGPNTNIRLDILGNDLRNRMEGGNGDDVFWPAWSNDVITGGKGRDTIQLSSNSGNFNVVTDFTPGEDRISLHFPVDKVQLRYREDFKLDGNYVKGTELKANDGSLQYYTGNLVDSVFSPSVSPVQRDEALKAINTILKAQAGNGFTLENLDKKDEFKKKLFAAITAHYPQEIYPLDAFLKEVQKPEMGLSDTNPLKTPWIPKKVSYNQVSLFVMDRHPEEIRGRIDSLFSAVVPFPIQIEGQLPSSSHPSGLPTSGPTTRPSSGPVKKDKGLGQ